MNLTNKITKNVVVAGAAVVGATIVTGVITYQIRKNKKAVKEIDKLQEKVDEILLDEEETETKEEGKK